jgi:predicted PurR-regulated permease PerM
MVPPPSRVRWFFLASAALSLAIVWGLALPLGIAAVLAFVSEGPVDFILKKLRRPNDRRVRWAVTTGFVLVIVAGFLVPLTFAATAAVGELIKLFSSMDWDKVSAYGAGYVDWVRNRVESLGFDIPENEVSTRVRAALNSGFSFLGTRLGALASSTPTLVFDLLILLLAWIVFAVEGRPARDRVLVKLIPWHEEREILRKTTAGVLRGVLVANVAVSVAQATLCSIALLIVQMPRAMVWGSLSFFLSFIPVVGTMPITLGAAIYCYSQGRVGAAVFMLAAAAAVGVVDNILRPLFMKSGSDLSFLWTLVAFIGGVSLFGLPGVIIGPLAFSLFAAYLRAMEVLPGDPLTQPAPAPAAPLLLAVASEAPRPPPAAPPPPPVPPSPPRPSNKKKRR